MGESTPPTVEPPPTTEDVLRDAREVLDHKTRSYVQAAARLSLHALDQVERRRALLERLRGRAEGCRRTCRAHAALGADSDPFVVAQALARAEAYEVAAADVEESLR